jgi:hypothetical protein
MMWSMWASIAFRNGSDFLTKAASVAATAALKTSGRIRRREGSPGGGSGDSGDAVAGT